MESTRSDVPEAEVLEALLRAFRELSAAIREATASRFQPLVSIYSLIACKVHAPRNFAVFVAFTRQ